MKMRYGLQARVFTALLAALVITLTVMALVLQRQEAMREDMLDGARDAMNALVHSRLQANVQASVDRLAGDLVNPLYYFDMEAIGKTIASVQRQADVEYVVVYSPTGEVLHDGSREIATFGQSVDEALASGAIGAEESQGAGAGRGFEVSAPITIGDQGLGGVRVGYSLDSVRQDARQATGGLRAGLEEIASRHGIAIAALFSLLVVVAAIMVLLAQRTLVRPVRRLAEVAREIESGNFDVNVPDSRRNDEVGELERGFRRMSESIARHDRDIRRMAYTDALTGLHNRLAFREILDQRIAANGAGGNMALLFADIDNFKRINDTLGHDAGDEVLVQFAERIRDVVERHAASAVVARFGGDEFVVLQPVPASADARQAAGQLAGILVEEVGRPLMVAERPVFLGLSIGVTLFPDDAASAALLMKNGDIAMYQAKVAGKNCHRFYSRAMDQAVERRVRMEQDLRGAWERGELSVVYQPLFNMADSRLVGAEALLRWRHPTQGMVAPSVFIDVAEQSGLIEGLGVAVLAAACKEAVGWQERAGPEGMFVSVNVSPRQLRSGDLAQQVEDVLRQTSLPPARLHLELTETAVLGDELRTDRPLARLREAGVKVWLDDFGTGFSGLSHLRRIPIDGVKIDRSFIADVLRDPDDLALTTAIIAMARSLGMTVVAEGVEREGQFELLRERGCDLAQGYWLGHPVSGEELRMLI
ncbi:putative bifunctional diguanylate cyclase/phosphodiesterase [Luteimonas sp. A478]